MLIILKCENVAWDSHEIILNENLERHYCISSQNVYGFFKLQNLTKSVISLPCQSHKLTF